MADYSEALRLDHGTALRYNGLAWILATCPQDSVRNGKLAVEYATKANDMSGSKESGYLDTLAAAYAEIGDFEQAVATQKKAIELAAEAAKADFTSRLNVYESRKPYREGK